jgi:hypothetical protein
VQCQLGNATVSVPARDPAPVGITPGAVPTFYQGVPGLMTLAASEPMPGLSLELRLLRTTFVAGAVIQPEIRVRNMTAAEVFVSDAVSVIPDGQEQAVSAAVDPRSFPNFVHGPYSPGFAVPTGQTWTIPSMFIQLPFDGAQPVHLHTLVGLSTAAAPGITVIADSPLRLIIPTTAQELHLELHADNRQWCVKAIDASGGPPSGPLFAGMTARSGSAYMEGPGSAGTGNAWAARWDSNSFPTNAPIALAFWVGGPNYVTAQAQAKVSAGP